MSSLKIILIAGMVLVPAALLLVLFLRRRSTKDFLFKVVLLVLAIAAAGLILEVFLRVQSRINETRNARALRGLQSTPAPPPGARVSLQHIIRMSPNPRMVYQLIPNLQVRFMHGNVTTGPDGFRTTPGSSTQSNAVCVLGLGDSVMFGWGVNDEDTYLSGLCRQLNARDGAPPLKVVNMAVPGYNTVMEVETLKTLGLPHKPKVVLIHFVENDLFLPNFICQENPDFKPTRSYLLAELSRLVESPRAPQPFEVLVRTTDTVPARYADMVGEKACRAALRELGDLGIQHGFKVIILTNWDAPGFIKEAAGASGMQVLELGSLIAEYMKQHDIPEYRGSILTVSKGDPHYSAVAHELIAGKIAAILQPHL